MLNSLFITALTVMFITVVTVLFTLAHCVVCPCVYCSAHYNADKCSFEEFITMLTVVFIWCVHHSDCLLFTSSSLLNCSLCCTLYNFSVVPYAVQLLCCSLCCMTSVVFFMLYDFSAVLYAV